MSIMFVIIKLLLNYYEADMKKLRPIGNSWGIIIPKTILEIMGINPVLDNIDVDLDNKVLKIKKSKENK